jgi:hypothetical protein
VHASIHRVTDSDTNATDILERVLTEARTANGVSDLHRTGSMRSSLKALGFAAPVDFLRVLMASRPRLYFPSDVAALSAISHDRQVCRKLQGSFLGEHLLYLLSHELIRRSVTRRFLREMNHCPVSDQQAIWMAAKPVVAAMETGLVPVTRISSVQHYLELAEVARHQLNSTAYRFPAPPFPLPDGWRWFESGADFRSLADYSPSELLHQMEFHHHSVIRGSSFLLRDPAGCGWNLYRLPSGKLDNDPIYDQARTQGHH